MNYRNFLATLAVTPYGDYYKLHGNL